MRKNIRYLLEGIVLYVLYTISFLLPARTASRMGGKLAEKLGPLTGAHRGADRNLQGAFPMFDATKREEILRAMWYNLGATFAEYPHLKTLARDCCTITGIEHLKEPRAKGQPIIFIGGHLGNWEISAAASLMQLNIPVDLTYRAMNNPWAERLLRRARTLNHALLAFPKGDQGGRQILKSLRAARVVGILIDQKYNQGITAHFFCRPAMTNPIFVQLAQKYNAVLIPIRTRRLENAHFTLDLSPPLQLHMQDGTPRPVTDVISEAHKFLEDWITQDPGQWLWVHNRWQSRKPSQQIEDDFPPASPPSP